MSEEVIVKHVQTHARYITSIGFADGSRSGHANLTEPYVVDWNGKSFYASNPRGLVRQIVKHMQEGETP